MFKGKTVVITGGANGIGKAAASLFLERGANVSIWDFNEEVGKQTVTEFGVAERTLFCKVNVASMEDCVSAASATVAKFGRIDVLINNAGITRDGLLMRMTEENFNEVVRTNLNSVFNITKACQRPMLKQRSGSIINISSVVGVKGNAGQANYAASKAGIIGFTKSVALELGSRSIRCNAIAPGFIETEMTDVLPAETVKQWREAIPLKRGGTPEDVANAVLFLASDLSTYITGQVLNVDGGMLT